MTHLTPEELAENVARVRELAARFGDPTMRGPDAILAARRRLVACEDGPCADCKEPAQQRVVYGDIRVCGACATSRLKVAAKLGVMS